MKVRYGAIMMAVFGFVWAGGSYAADAPNAIKDYNDGIRAHAEMLKARAEYLKALVEARLADSRERLINAEAEYKTTLAAALRVQIDAMQYELARIKAEDAKIEWKVREIEGYAECTANLSMGDSNHEVIYQCLMPFLRTYVSANILRDVMKVQVGPLAENHFRANDASSYLEPFPGGNMGQLIEFIGSRDLSMVRWSPPHFLFLDMMNSLGAYAEHAVQRYQSYLIGIRSGTLNIWTLPES